MIPVKLAVRNFMCYRDNVPPLNFSGIHLACLSGDNGNGKSALIDAMTWALWGETRARSDDDLVYTGQTEMEVVFDFAVGQQVYRVIRKHSRPRRQARSGQTMLEFQIATGNGFRPISAEGITQTQRKIIDVLHMDYDTFINSAYLRQGHADEFTRQPPFKRKEVLASILGFAFYDGLEDRARELAKQQETEKARLESAIKDISDELAQKPACEAELAQSQAELGRLEAAAKEKEAELGQRRQKKESLDQSKLQLDELRARMADTERDLALWDEQVSQHRARLEGYAELVAQRQAIEEGYARFIEARKLGDDLERKFRQLVNLERQQAQLESRIKAAGQGLVTQHAVAQHKVEELNARLQRLPELRSGLQQVRDEMGQLAEREAVLVQKKQAAEALQSQVNRLESDKTRVECEIAEISEKLTLLSTKAEARCPLCETELGADGLKLIRSKYAEEARSKSESLKSSQAELVDRRTEFDSLKSETSRLESWLNQSKAAAQSQAGILKKEIAESEEAEKQLASERERLAQIEQRLAGRDFATAEQGALAQIESEVARLGYSPELHEQVRNQQKEFEQYDQSKRQLDEADSLVSQAKEAGIRAEEAAAKLRRSLETDGQKARGLSEELAQLPQALADLALAEGEFQGLSTKRSQAQEMVWSARARLERCAELEAKKREKEGLLANAAKEEDIYKELARAFGKGGIQALLIEMVLPEIEAEANRLLARMTDNRMHVKFETQRETRKGSVLETLDINIADELGTRNYEMFSGGEAFRINFAIRIALSRLLARRAGAPLPTLIIDEGFGTQDVGGIEKLKEAINSIQDDFEKIIVVTHVEELRDAFPTRIDVVKTAEGSTFSVN